MRNRIVFIFAVLALLFGAGRVRATELTITNTAGLVEETGRPVVLDDYRDYLRLVFFGYTHCPDICPLTLYYVGAALKSLGPAAERIRVLFITVDPKRDTAAALAKYTGAFHPSIVGLTGDLDAIASLTASFRTAFGYTLIENGKERPVDRSEYATMPADAAYVPYHSSQLYILDREGRLLDVIGYGSSAEDIAARLREHLE